MMRVAIVLAACAYAAAALPTLDVVMHGAEDAPFRVLVVCGFHPRERITRELCARWNTLLAERPPTRVRIDVVADVNPEGTALNASCWRGNARGVDLNRNWPPIAECVYDVHEATKSFVRYSEEEWSHGEAPFSEWETRTLDAITRHASPDLVLAVHSGVLAFLMPYDSCERSPANINELARLGGWLRHGVCDKYCPVARSAFWLGSASGTYTDYVYHTLGVPLVYTLEVYKPPDDECECEHAFSPPPGAPTAATLARWDPLLLKVAHANNDDFTTLLEFAGIYTPK
jgi:hypothetical protein